MKHVETALLLMALTVWAFLAIGYIACDSDALPPAELAKISAPALACIHHQVMTAYKEKDAGANCKEAVAALAVVVATDPDCIAAKFTDSDYSCQETDSGK